MGQCNYAVFVPEHFPPPERSNVQHPDLAKYVKDWGRAHDDSLVDISSEGGASLGAAWCRLFNSADQGYGYVDDQTPELSVGVLPGHRRQGIGTRLLTQLLQEVRTKYRFVSLSVSADNPARTLYKHLGFEEIDRYNTSVTIRKDLPSYPSNH